MIKKLKKDLKRSWSMEIDSLVDDLASNKEMDEVAEIWAKKIQEAIDDEILNGMFAVNPIIEEYKADRKKEYEDNN